MWIFESEGGLPAHDLRVVVPNGRHRLVIPWRNGLVLQDGDRVETFGDPVLVGLWDRPVSIGSEPLPTVSIGVELTAAAITRFFRVGPVELTDRAVPLVDAWAPGGRLLAERLRECPSVEAAAGVLHGALLAALLDGDPRPTVVDHALAAMAAAGYRMPIGELARQTGYSRRRLSTLFLERTGLPPSELQAILAFEQVYRRLGVDRSPARLRDLALGTYADQPHFIRRFRQFTGMAPRHFLQRGNEFGLLFYGDHR